MFFTTKNVKCITFFFILSYCINFIQLYAEEDSISVIDKIKKEHKIISIKNVNLKNLNNEIINIKKLQSDNSILLINFWALWCAPCIKEIPDLKIISKKIEKYGFKLIYINQDNKNELSKIILFLKDNNMNKNIVFVDHNKEIAKKFFLRGLPTTFIVNKKGEVDYRIEGIISNKDEKFLNWLTMNYTKN